MVCLVWMAVVGALLLTLTVGQGINEEAREKVNKFA